MVCLETLNCSSVAVSPDSCLRYGQVSGKLKAQSMRHEPGPGASRRDATRTDSSFRVVATSRLVAPTEFDRRLHPFSRGSTCRPDRARHQTPSSEEAAYSTRRPVRLVGRPLSLRQSSTRPTTRPVGSGPTRATPQTPRGVSRDASGQRPDSSDHQSRRLGFDSCDSSDFSICRTTRPAVGPTRQTRGRPQAGPTRPTRQTPRSFSPPFWSAGAVVCALCPLHTFDLSLIHI